MRKDKEIPVRKSLRRYPYLAKEVLAELEKK